MPKRLSQRRGWVQHCIAGCVLLTATICGAGVAGKGQQAAGAQEAQSTAAEHADPNVLVRRAVNAELHDSPIHFMYRLHKLTPERNETRECLETVPGTICRVIALNDQPLSPEQDAKERSRIEHLVNTPDAWADRQKKQKEDADRARKMVAALPDAFIYKFEGTEDNGRVVRLSFRPNPNWDAPSRELKVYEGMQGNAWIDQVAGRMVRIDATLFEDVDFGWGILGRLYKGGHFLIAQQPIAPERWETTKTVLDFTGKVMLFKSLRIKETETLTDFRRIDDHLNLAQGLKMLEEFNPQQDMVAERDRKPQPQGGSGPE
jgi:hypothetical protein